MLVQSHALRLSNERIIPDVKGANGGALFLFSPDDPKIQELFNVTGDYNYRTIVLSIPVQNRHKGWDTVYFRIPCESKREILKIGAFVVEGTKEQNIDTLRGAAVLTMDNVQHNNNNHNHEPRRKQKNAKQTATAAAAVATAPSPSPSDPLFPAPSSTGLTNHGPEAMAAFVRNFGSVADNEMLKRLQNNSSSSSSASNSASSASSSGSSNSTCDDPNSKCFTCTLCKKTGFKKGTACGACKSTIGVSVVYCSEQCLQDDHQRHGQQCPQTNIGMKLLIDRGEYQKTIDRQKKLFYQRTEALRKLEESFKTDLMTLPNARAKMLEKARDQIQEAKQLMETVPAKFLARQRQIEELQQSV